MQGVANVLYSCEAIVVCSTRENNCHEKKVIFKPKGRTEEKKRVQRVIDQVCIIIFTIVTPSAQHSNAKIRQFKYTAQPHTIKIVSCQTSRSKSSFIKFNWALS